MITPLPQGLQSLSHFLHLSSLSSRLPLQCDGPQAVSDSDWDTETPSHGHDSSSESRVIFMQLSNSHQPFFTVPGSQVHWPLALSVTWTTVQQCCNQCRYRCRCTVVVWPWILFPNSLAQATLTFLSAFD